MAFLIEPLSLSIFAFDIVESEGYQRAVEWTSFPVESGLGVSDHAIDTPAEVSFKGVVSDHPLSGVIEPMRATRAYEQLVAMMEAKRLVTVVSGLTVLSDMGIVSVNASRDADTGAAVEPEVTLRRIRIVQSVSVPIPPEILAPKAIGAASPVELPSVHSALDPGQMQIRNVQMQGYTVRNPDGTLTVVPTGNYEAVGLPQSEVVGTYFTRPF